MTFTVQCRPGPTQARESQARPVARKTITYQPGPGPGLQVSGPHPARPAKCHRILARPGPWAAGWPGPRAEARPVQDPSSYVYAVVSLAAGGPFVGGPIVTYIFSRVSVGSACVRVWKRDCDVTSLVEHRVKSLQQNGP